MVILFENSLQQEVDMSPCTFKKNCDDKQFAIVKLSGSLVFEDVVDVSKEVKCIFAEGWDNVIIDMSEITHLNSKGIGALISIHANRSYGKRKFVILNPSPDVIKILTITKLINVFKICDGSIDDAKKMFL